MINPDEFQDPPDPPPARSFKTTFLFGLVETNESEQRTRDWHNYMRGYKAGRGFK